MGIHTLTLIDGSKVQVEAPRDTPIDELLRMAEAQQGSSWREDLVERQRLRREAREARVYPEPPEPEEESGFFGDLVGGFGAGVVGIGETAALGAATMLDEEEELAARERIKGFADAIRPTMGDEEDLTYKIGSTFGSIAGFLGAGAAVAAGAGALGAGAGAAGLAGLLGAGTLGVGAGAGEASERAREFGATEEERNRAVLQGAVVGATEVLPLRRVLGKLTGDLGEEVVQGFRQRIVSALRTGGEEAAQEAAAGIAQNLIERGYNIDQAVLEGAGEAAALGGGAGATIQLLVDALAGRRARGATPPPEETPLPEETPPLALPAPEGIAGLIPDQRANQARALIGQALDERGGVSLEEMQGIVQQTQVPLPQLERVVAEEMEKRGAALAERARGEMEAEAAAPPLEPSVTPRMEQAVADARAGRDPVQADIARREQEAQAAAREREGMRAARRGDEAAFEQPDLFALQQEQERRRLGPEELRRPDQYMDELLYEQPEAPVRETPAAMGDLVDMAGERQRAAREEAGIAEQLAAIDREEAAQRQQAAAVRAESDLETIAGQQETQRQQATEQGRRRILQDVIEKTPSRNYNQVRRAYETALTEQGYQGTRAKATDAELQTIQRAVNVQRAERPAPEQAAPVQAPPEATQLTEMEARIPERARRVPEQLGLPGVRRRTQQAPVREGMPTEEAAPERKRISDADLDAMGIARSAKIRQRVRGRYADEPTVRQTLADFAGKSSTSQVAKTGINRFLQQSPEGQLDLFQPRRGARTPVRPAAETTPTPQQAAAQQPQVPEPTPTPEAADVTTAPITDRTGERAPRGGQGVAGRGPRGGRGRPGGAAAPTRAGLGERVSGAARPATPAEPERAALTEPRGEEGTTRKIIPTLPRRPVIDKKTLKPISEERTGPTSRALAPREKISAKRAPAKESVEAINKRLKDWYEANVSEPAKRFVKELGLSITSPLTVADKTAVLEVLNTKATKANKATIGALKKYLGAYPDPALGLQDAIDDVVAQTPNFRRTDDMTDGESEFFGADKNGTIPARGKNAAQAVLDWASKNMSEATKRWMAGKTVESKNAKQAVEAFESTDLVAKQRELEKAFEGGFDPTNDADNKRLAEVLEKLGIDETDPMVRGLMTSGSLFNLEVPASRLPLSNVVVGMLTKGDLGAALRTVAATSNDPEVTAVAAKLAKMVGDTKVELAGTLRAPDGRRVAGAFDAETNTIMLSTKEGLNTHTLLHEMTHAATVATLAKKSHPLTRKLQKIYEETKPHAPTAYGFTNLQEFVAEAFTNPQFQTVLAGLRVNGEPITPFAKFKAAISNFLRSLIGKPVKPVESALDQTTSIIDNILAPAPNNIGNGQFFMLSPSKAGQRVADMLNGVQRSIKPATKEFTQNFSDQVIEFLRGKGKDTVKRTTLGFLPSQAVADVAERAGVIGAMDLHKLMEEQRGAINKSDQEVAGVLKRVSDWTKKNESKVDALNRVIYKSTTEQVDPTKPVTAYKDNPEKLKAWKAMRKDWSSIGPEGHKIYTQMRDTYKAQYMKMRDVIYGKIDDTITDEAARKKLKNEVYARLFDTGTIEPYFPLTRSGDYWLSYVADGEFVVEAFETLAARDRAINDLKSDSTVKNIEKFVNVNNANYAKAPPSSFVGQTLQTLRANKVPDDVQAEILRLFVESLPETSFAKSLQRRKGTAGYQEDAIHALRTKAFDLGRQVERLRYSAKLRDLQDKINEQNADKLTDETKYIVDELNARADFARNPPKDGFAQAANRAAFVFTIGFNASSALVNLSQVPLFAYPMLAGRYGYGATGKAIKDASKLVTSSGFSRMSPAVAPYGNERNIKVRATPSIDNYFELDANGDYVIRKDLNLDPETKARVEEIKPVMQMLAERGQLNRSLFADNLGLDSSGRERGIIDTATAASAFMFHNVEVYNKQVTSVAAYLLELNRLKTAEPGLSTAERQQKAAEHAIYKAQQINGGSVLETAPRFGQQGIGRVALMYKTYGIQMYYTMFKTVRDGIEAHYAGDTEARNAAMRQIGGILGTSFLLAGAVGMPLARELMQLWNLFLDDEEDDAETIVRKALGEGVYKGPLTELLGVDLSSRIGLSGLILQANRFNNDPSPEETIFYYLGGPAWSTASGILRGWGDITDGNVERGVEAMLPGGVRNAYQALVRFPRDDGILTRRGDPIMDDLSFGELAAKAIGFAPAEYTRTQEMNQQTKNIDRAVNAKRTTLLRKYYVAMRMGDYDESRRILQDIGAFNKRHPTARIDQDSFRRSMRQHMETSATMYNGVTLSPNMRQALEASRNEWDQGFQLF